MVSPAAFTEFVTHATAALLWTRKFALASQVVSAPDGLSPAAFVEPPGHTVQVFEDTYWLAPQTSGGGGSTGGGGGIGLMSWQVTHFPLFLPWLVGFPVLIFSAALCISSTFHCMLAAHAEKTFHALFTSQQSSRLDVLNYGFVKLVAGAPGMVRDAIWRGIVHVVPLLEYLYDHLSRRCACLATCSFSFTLLLL